ncbi:hypothetical protein ACFHW2_11780 [Actinomadura sp. LOL_016]|uniref:hypothetical protein n=1 Tax=unclassified Actinomadura TaxID=2626254 RepID=UPI003A80E24E
MARVRAYAYRGARLLPYDGGAPLIPPDPDTGEGGGGGGPGSGSGLLVGAAIDPPNQTGFTQANTQMGPWTVHRGFTSGGFPAAGWSGTTCGWDPGRWASVWSGKPSPTSLASGSLDNATRNFLLSIPASHTAFVTIWHESDVKIKQGTAGYSAAQYKAAWQRFFAIVREVQADRPHLYGCLIFGSYSYINPKPGATLPELWPGNGSDGRPLVDLVAFDGYAFTGNESGSYMWGAGRQFADQHGVAWGIAEAGLAQGVTGPAGATWMQTQADYAAVNGAGPHSSAAFLCWFGSTVGDVLATPGHYSQTRAKSAAISQQYYSPFTEFRL